MTARNGLNPAQQQTAEAYAQVFAPSRQTELVLDDLTVFANALPESQQAGGIRVLGYIFLKRSTLRRAKAKENV